MSELRSLDDLDPTELATTIDRNGYAVVEDYVASDALARAQHFIRETASASGGQYVFVEGSEGLGDTFLSQWAHEPSLLRLTHAVCEHSVHHAIESFRARQTLRVLCGDTGKAQSLIFHYDSYVLTAIVPVMIPATGRTGDLLILPNTRPLRRFYLHNVVDKLRCDRQATQVRLRSRHDNGELPRIKLKPGNMYLFWGYRSLHTNDACDADDIRCTAILHFADPHEDSAMKKLLRIRSPAPPAAAS